MAELTVNVVSAERALWSGSAKSVVAKTPEGEIGIMPGHEPVLALLVESPLRVEQADGTKMLVAVLAEDIDLDRAKVALAAAQAANDEDTSALRRAETRITVAGTASALR